MKDEVFVTDLNHVGRGRGRPHQLVLVFPRDGSALAFVLRGRILDAEVVQVIREVRTYDAVSRIPDPGDVVGLGKTYISALLAQQLDGRHLIIAPPMLLDQDSPGSWPNVFSDFKESADFESLGKLDKLLKRDISKYKNVFNLLP